MFEQERMIGRLQRRVTSEPGIIACFLSGSYGRRTEDGFSDLDVALVFRNEDSRERNWQDRINFTQSIMPYVAFKSFDATHVRPYFHVALFANGCKVDLRYETSEDLLPNPWDSQIRILKDSAGWATSFQKASATLPNPQPKITLQELQSLDQRFWVMFWDVLRQLGRGNAIKPFDVYLELLYFHLPALLKVLPVDDPAHIGLVSIMYNRDPRTTTRELLDLLAAYLVARDAVTNRHHLQFVPNKAFESQIQNLAAKLI